jgi:microcystin-dependent protein
MGYLTPSVLPTDTICRVLFIPNDEEWIAIATGALQLLTFADSFVLQGSLTPQQTSDRFVTMFDDFCFNRGVCRVIGEIVAFASTTSPDVRWLACDGASLLRADYPDLFAVIGVIYGSVDGTHFNLPDARGRIFMDAGTGPGLTARSIGASLGEETHLLTVTETPSHSHTDTGHVHTTGNSLLLGTSAPPPLDALGPNPLPAFTGSASANLTSTGGSGTHNNIQPSLVISYFIVAKD